jgi:hypothetical protein
MRKIFFWSLLLSVISLATISCKKIDHRIEETTLDDTPGKVADTTFMPVNMTFPEARFTEKESFSTNQASNKILSRLISLLDASNEGTFVYISVYQINHDDVLDAIKRADNRGVQLRILVDMSRLESQRINPKALNFLRNPALSNTQVWDTNNDIADAALNENKFALFSEIETTTGMKQHVVFQTSHNFTETDSHMGHDALTLSHEGLYDAYLIYWNELKNRAISGMKDYNFATYKSVPDGIEAYFLPQRNNGATISGDLSLDLLNKISNPATAEIKVAMSFWDNTRIAILNKLVQLQQAGAKVELVIKSNISATQSSFEALESNGGFIRMLNVNDNNRPLTNMDNRFTLIKGTFDGVPSKVAITGTLSFTGNSLNNNNEIVLLLKNDEIYDQYEEFFGELKSLPEYRTGGIIYQGFPETFETTDPNFANVYKAGTNVINLSTGQWKFNDSGFRGDAVDKIVSGRYAWRSNFNINYSIYLGMEFDVPNASKVSFYYGAWGTAATGAACTFVLEYSTDQGTTWTQTGNPITQAVYTPTLATFPVDFNVPVRFRIHRKGQVATGAGNGRLNIDDFSVYKQPTN